MVSRRIAIVSYFTPPHSEVASHRIFRQTRAILRAGHDVHWVTLDKDKIGHRFDPTLFAAIPPEVKRHELGGPCLVRRPARNLAEKVLRNALIELPKWAAIPDGYLEWPLRLRRHLARIVEEQALDTVLFSFGPHGALMLLPRLRRQAPGLKILVDYRDLLTGNSWTAPRREGTRKRLLERERRALRAADALFVTSSNAAQTFHNLVLPPDRIDVQVMRNAVDHELAREMTSHLERPDLGEGIHVGYFGNAFLNRPLKPLLEAIERIGGQGTRKIFFHVYGYPPTQELVRNDAAGVGATAVESLVLHDPVPFAQALCAMQAMDALVLSNGPTEEDRIFIPGKLYDYMMARRPILFVGDDSDASQIVAEYCGGQWCCPYAEPRKLDRALLALASERTADIEPNTSFGPETAFAPMLDILARE